MPLHNREYLVMKLTKIVIVSNPICYTLLSYLKLQYMLNILTNMQNIYIFRYAVSL